MASANPAARYVTDIPYARRFVRELSPSWLDFTALICGFRPPSRADGFAWCELGCGHGVTPALLAAAHPEGRFHGIDLMPQHVEFAENLCRDAGTTNAAFHAVDFAGAQSLDLPRFDFIVAHGVYTWIDAAAQADLLRFVDRHLKPGGLLYLSYDSLPGWAGDMPLQHLLRVLTEHAQGDSVARLDGADKIITVLQSLGADVLRLGAMGREWEELRRKLPPSYFVHQFLPPAWKPLYLTEVRQAVSGIGLAPIGSATIRENVDAFTLDRTARELVAAASDPDLRELLRDYLLMKRFRRDVFGRDVPRLDETEARRRICDGTYMLSHPRIAAEDAIIPFNHPAAQAILALLESGPASPIALTEHDYAIDALVAQIIALASAGRIWPIDADADEAGIERINAVLRRRIGTPDKIAFAMLPGGMAIEHNAGIKEE
jgi:SAM-dependent methyltransferase